MARLEHIKRRLDNWALWKARMNDGGQGWRDRNPLAVWAEDVWSRTSYHGASIPTLTKMQSRPTAPCRRSSWAKVTCM